MHLGEIQTRVTTSHAEVIISHTSFPYIKERDFSPQRKGNQHEHHLQHYHRNHTQDLRLFRCELLKVA